MPPRTEPVAYRARWVLPIDRPPLEYGLVTVMNGRIVEVGEATSAAAIIDLGSAWLLPAFVNAHTHLELSNHHRPLGKPRQPFPEWIAEVVAWRRQQFAAMSVGELQQQRVAAIDQGLKESAAAGIALVGDIASADWPASTYANSSVSGVIFEELLGLASEQIEPLYQRACQQFDRVESGWQLGISPHAPYTVSQELLRRVCELAGARQATVAMHLAESREELQLLETHSGPFVPVLEALNAWRPECIPRGSRPYDYLELLSEAGRALVIHGNYLTPTEIDFLSQRREFMSLVYCPRTHDYFHAAEHPLRAALQANVRVALGTDSRASNPDLSIWNELHFLRQRYPELKDEVLLRLATIEGAAALGMEQHYGSLTPGKMAAMVIAEGSAENTPLFERSIRPLIFQPPNV